MDFRENKAPGPDFSDKVVLRRLLEMAYLYAWGPEGSADARDEWWALKACVECVVGTMRWDSHTFTWLDPQLPQDKAAGMSATEDNNAQWQTEYLAEFAKPTEQQVRTEELCAAYRTLADKFDAQLAQMRGPRYLMVAPQDRAVSTQYARGVMDMLRLVLRMEGVEDKDIQEALQRAAHLTDRGAPLGYRRVAEALEPEFPKVFYQGPPCLTGPVEKAGEAFQMGVDLAQGTSRTVGAALSPKSEQDLMRMDPPRKDGESG